MREEYNFLNIERDLHTIRNLITKDTLVTLPKESIIKGSVRLYEAITRRHRVLERCCLGYVMPQRDFSKEQQQRRRVRGRLDREEVRLKDKIAILARDLGLMVQFLVEPMEKGTSIVTSTEGRSATLPTWTVKGAYKDGVRSSR